jgi:hypothetical protein
MHPMWDPKIFHEILILHLVKIFRPKKEKKKLSFNVSSSAAPRYPGDAPPT